MMQVHLAAGSYVTHDLVVPGDYAGSPAVRV